MKMNIKKIPLFVFAICICSMLSAQSIWWAENKTEYCRKLSDNIYVPVNSDGSLGMASYEIKNNQFWLIIGESSEYKGYYTSSANEYVYYDRNDNIVASYVPSQGRYYAHSSQGHTILKSESYAVLINGAFYQNMNDETIIRYTVDEGFDPVVVGFFLLVQ